MQDWWEELFEQMLEVSVWNLMRIEEHNDGSMEALALLVEAADNYNFIQQAYVKQCYANEHAEFFVCD